MLMLFLVTVIALDYFRVEHGIRIPFFYIMYRKNEADRFGDHIFFALGAISVIALFTREIAYASILMATFGDLAAALIEKFYGKRRVFQTIFKNDKSVEGSSSEFIIDFLIGLLILGNPIVSLVMAFLATLRKPHPIKLTITSWYQFSPVFSGRLSDFWHFIIISRRTFQRVLCYLKDPQRRSCNLRFSKVNSFWDYFVNDS